MGLFKRKDKTSSDISSRKNSSSPAETSSLGQSSTSSLKSPTTPGYPKMPPPVIPKIDMPKAPDPTVDPAGYLRSIGSVRERSNLVLKKARRNELQHFHVDMSKFEDTTKFVISIIKVSP
jgi:hypothetical protein